LVHIRIEQTARRRRQVDKKTENVFAIALLITLSEYQQLVKFPPRLPM